MTKPTEEQINEWYKVLYQVYPNDLSHGKKGNEIPIKNAMRKKITSQAKFDEIKLSIQALTRYDRMDKEPDRWPLISTFLNQEYYNRQIGSTAELKEKQCLKTCSVDGCNHDVHGEKYIVCSMHIPCQHDERLRAAWKKTGISRTSPTMRADCLEYLKQYWYGWIR